MNFLQRKPALVVNALYPLIFVLLILISTMAVAQTPRGRPAFSNNTLVADNGQLLRGTMWNTDIRDQLPRWEWIDNMREQGFNTLHLYAESFCDDFVGVPYYPPGSRLETVMQINQMVKVAGLYLVITIGNGCSEPVRPGEPGIVDENYNIEFAEGFWDIYASHFANEPHVIFELYNEPWHTWPEGVGLTAQPTTDGVIELEARAYLAARRRAPETPILLFSYGTLKDGPAAHQDYERVANSLVSVQRGNNKIMLENIGIAYHHYYVRNDILSNAIRTLQGLGHNLVMTEMQRCHGRNCPCPALPDPTLPTESPCIRADYTLFSEQHEISWLAFLRLNLLAEDGFDRKIRNYLDYGINGNSVVWIPDYGEWPVKRMPPPQSSSFYLNSHANANWVSASRMGLPPGGGPLTADRQDAGGWERFANLNRPNSRVCLRSDSNQTQNFVNPGWVSSETPLIANQSVCSANMEFDWLKRPDGSVLLRAPHRVVTVDDKPSWRFVSVDLDRPYPELVDSSTTAGPRERFDVLQDCALPSITQQPVGRMVNIGATVSFTVGSNGNQFQWQKNQNNIAGANASNYTISNAQPSDAGAYRVRVSNVCGSVLSVTVTLTVQDGSLQQPFHGAPVNIPGPIQFEDYDLGGEGIAYHDLDLGNTGGHHRNDDVDIFLWHGEFGVGWTGPHEWLEYTVDVTGSGVYDLEVRYATILDNRQLSIDIDGAPVVNEILTETGAWGDFHRTYIRGIQLPLGTGRVLRVTVPNGGLNLESMHWHPALATAETAVALDTFSGVTIGAGLDGRTLAPGQVWASTHALFAIGNSVTAATGTNPTATLPFNPADYGNQTVVVEAEVNPQDANWLAIGFSNHPHNSWLTHGQIWVLLKPSGHYNVLANGTQFSLSNGQKPIPSVAGFRGDLYNNARLVYTPSSRRAELYINGILVMPSTVVPAGFVPNISRAGFAGQNLNHNQSRLDNVRVAVRP